MANLHYYFEISGEIIQMLQIWFISSEMTEIPGGPHVCENFLTPGGIGALTEAHNQSLEVQCCS